MKAESNDRNALAAHPANARVGGRPHGAPGADETLGFFTSLLGRMRSRWATEEEAPSSAFETAFETAVDNGVASDRRGDDPVDPPSATPAAGLPPPPAAPPAPLPGPPQPRQGERGPRGPVDGATRTAVAAPTEPASTKQQELVEHLAVSVRDFCNDGATQGREGWTIRLELNPVVLPNTSLEMDLSPQWLLLRFSPRDPDCHALITQGAEQLQSILSEVVNPKRNVVVSIE